ncbi:MAG: sulfotransferase domain-containing protein [Nannocystaceae bacterium]
MARPHREFRDFWWVEGGPPLSTKLRYLLRYQFKPYYFVRPPGWRVALRGLSWKQRPPPDFASIGAVRSGTSALSEYIFQHPSTVLPLAKEPNITVPCVKQVCSYFPTRAERARVAKRYGVAISGYCTPVGPHLSWPYLARGVNPNMKVVLILRDPVSRAFSQWKWDRMKRSWFARDPFWSQIPSFERVFEIERMDMAEGGVGWPTLSGLSGLLRQSIYLPFLKVLTDVWDADKLLILCAEEFFADPVATTEQVYEFLGLPPCTPERVVERNAGPQESLDPALRARMREFFQPYNERLYEFLGRDLGW